MTPIVGNRTDAFFASSHSPLRERHKQIRDSYFDCGQVGMSGMPCVMAHRIAAINPAACRAWNSSASSASLSESGAASTVARNRRYDDGLHHARACTGKALHKGRVRSVLECSR
jgi:hypothetical protein